jgi:RNA polymerase sigma-70 factor (ECF subfamily)
VDRYPFDAEYLSRLRDGDPMTLDHFVDYFSQKLRVKLYKFSKADQDDIIQETLARFFERLRVPDGIHSPNSLGAFVVRICQNVAHERYREDVGRQDQLDDDCVNIPSLDADAEHLLMQGEEGELVRQTLALLNKKDRALLIDLLVIKRNKDEICSEYGCTREYLRVLLHRAVVRFRFLYFKEKGKPPRGGK